MKRLLCAAAAVLTLLGCAAAPAETTLPPGTTQPAGTTAPGVDNDMSWQEQDLPIDDDPTDPTQPAVFSPYTIRIEDPETEIFAGPAMASGGAGLVQEAGVYTIVEEVTDCDGNLWGRLKSGAGWLCLTEPLLAPIHADYADEAFNAYHAYWSEDSDYITSIGFTATEVLTDVRFGMLDWFETESWEMAEELYTIDTLTPEQPFLAQVTFWGDMTTYGLSFTDADGARRHYYIMISGKDGSLICREYEL